MNATDDIDLLRLLEECSTATEVLRFWANRRQGAVAYTFLSDGEIEEASLTFGSLNRRALAVARWLRQHGAAGERVLLLYPPGLEFVVAFFGCLYAGAVAVPLYPPRPNRQDPRISDIRIDADARFALTSASTASTIARAIKHSPELNQLLWCETDELASTAADSHDLHAATSSDLAYLQYTSGSTRAPKGAMVTHSNLLAQLKDIELAIRHRSDSVFVTWLPHFHDMGLVYGLLMPVSLGLPCYVMPAASFLQRPARWLTAITRYKATHSGAPNFAYELCAERVSEAQKLEIDLRSWKFAFSGAEPVRAKTLDAFASAFASCGLSRAALSPAYGLAEATLKVTVEPPGREPRYLSVRASELARHRVVLANEDSGDARTLVGCGIAATTEILIVNPDTLIPCDADDVGEIWLRGPSVAQGYWRRSSESETTFQASPIGVGSSGYLRTGDLGFMHDGELFVTGRHKDLIIIRGRNHYPQDIETSVKSCHPAFESEAAVAFSIDVDEEEHLVVVQEVNRHYRSLDINEVAPLIRRCIADEHELSPYAIVLVKQNGIPKTSSGKVQRRACLQAFVNGSLESVAEWREARSTITNRPVTDAVPQPQPENWAPSQEDIESFLTIRLSVGLGIPADDIDLGQPFSAMGLDSVRAVEFLGELESWLGRRLSPTLFWNYPTVSDLAAFLAESTPDPVSTEIRQG